MKRILFYTDTPLLGGAENQMYLLAKFLPKERFTVTLACANTLRLNSWCQKFLELGIKVIRLKVLHKHDPLYFFYLKKLLPQFDLLHLHIWNPASGRFGFLAAGNKTPIVITEHDPFPLHGLKGWLKKKLMKKVKKIIVASRAAKELVLQQELAFKPLLRIIPNGIDIEAWRIEASVSNKNEFRRFHFKASPQEKVILCVAELHKRKGQKYLIEATHLLQLQIPEIKLVFVGDGPARKQYEAVARKLGNRVLFLGHRKEVAQLMAASDLFVLPSIREAFGLVILEASALELPVIASRVGGISEIIEDNKTGLLVPPENSRALADALSLLLKDPAHAAKLAKNARRRIETQFGAARMAEDTAAVYDECLKV